MKRLFGVGLLLCLVVLTTGICHAQFTARDFYGKTIYMVDMTHRMVFQMQFLETGVLQTTIIKPNVHQIGERFWSVKFGRLVIVPNRFQCPGCGNDEYFEILNDDPAERVYTVARKLIQGDVIWQRVVAFYYDQVTGYMQAVEVFENIPARVEQNNNGRNYGSTGS